MTEPWEADPEVLEDRLLPEMSDLSDLADDMGWSPEQEPDVEEVD